ncbi:MAG TPA: hypothetical protein VE755_00990 [Myxococcales bacterium]|nr:hypothetical protein [Myxococcales bacterium]
MADGESDATGQPAAADLLRAALEKIVFFEWRISELGGELAAAHARCANAEKGRAEAEEEARAAGRTAKAARLQTAELEAERARLSALLVRPGAGASDPAALETERRRAMALAAELEQARAELARSRAERERWVSKMIAQARSSDDDPALAQFISELRGEVIALRDYQKKCEALLAEAGIAPPAFEASQPAPLPEPRRTAEPVQEARRMWAEGRLASPPPPALTTHFAMPPAAKVSAAAQALADQCLRSLASADAGRREQAARHLVAAPLASAAPAVASALGAETDVKTRAQLAKALAACGGESAAEIVAQLQISTEPALVRLAALEALAAIPERARVALENAARDAAPAVRRRAAALAVALGVEDLAGRLTADEDATVRGAAAAARAEAPAPLPPQAQAPAPRPQAETPAQARDPVRAALRRLVLEGGSG